MEKERNLFWRDNGYVFWWFIHLRLLLPPSSDCIHFGRYVFSQNARRGMGLSVWYLFNTDYKTISFQIEHRPVFTLRWTIRHLSSTVWKRPVFQSWAYWRLASKCTEFSFCRCVDNKGHFIWAQFPRSRLTSKSFVKFFLCVHMKRRAGSAPEISVFPIGISVSRLEMLVYEHFSPVTGMKAGWILVVRMASSCIACSIFHIISIPFNCSDTVFCHVCFVSRIWRQNPSPGSLTFSHLRNRAEIFHINPRRNSSR